MPMMLSSFPLMRVMPPSGKVCVMSLPSLLLSSSEEECADAGFRLYKIPMDFLAPITQALIACSWYIQLEWTHLGLPALWTRQIPVALGNIGMIFVPLR